MRSTSLRALVALGAVCAVALPAVGFADASPTCTASIGPGAAEPGDMLLAVAGAPRHAVAAGIHFDGGDGRPLVQRLDGDTWSRFPIPIHAGAGTIQFQDAVVAGDRVWAVGTLRNDKPMAGWLADDRWHWSAPVDPGGVEDEFLGVAALPDGTLWAVGKHREDADYQPLIERFDGTAWTVVPSPPVKGSAVLKDIAVTPDGSMWAVGWSVSEGGVTLPLIEQWFEGSWLVDNVPGRGLLSGIALLPSGSAIAVGWRETPAGDRTFTLVLEALGWALAPPDGSDQPGRLTSVATGEAVVAVGSRFDDAGVPQALVARWDEQAERWIALPAGDPSIEPGGDQLTAITGEPGSFLAVGIGDTPESFGSLVVSGSCVR